MHRKMMGGRPDRQHFAARVLAAFKSGDIEEDDLSVTAAAVAVAMIIGALLGSTITAAISEYAAVSAGVM